MLIEPPFLLQFLRGKNWLSLLEMRPVGLSWVMGVGPVCRKLAAKDLVSGGGPEFRS